ncbi:hypothetical protein DL771_002810 [Monosporascus sp. 5C6A]|nr:hypothetical protein DL771_002810 [Monosporascus sp. 5C6A]
MDSTTLRDALSLRPSPPESQEATVPSSGNEMPPRIVFDLFLTLSFCILTQPDGSLLNRSAHSVLWAPEPSRLLRWALVIWWLLLQTAWRLLDIVAICRVLLRRQRLHPWRLIAQTRAEFHVQKAHNGLLDLKDNSSSQDAPRFERVVSTAMTRGRSNNSNGGTDETDYFFAFYILVLPYSSVISMLLQWCIKNIHLADLDDLGVRLTGLHPCGPPRLFSSLRPGP